MVALTLRCLFISIAFNFLYPMDLWGNQNHPIQLPQVTNLQLFDLENDFNAEQDSIPEDLERAYKQYLENGDSLQAIRILNNLAGFYSNRANYDKSYEAYWKALLLSDEMNNLETKAAAYNGIGILYSLYERREEALDYYLKALELRRNLVMENMSSDLLLARSYFSLAIHYRYEKEFKTARNYLDSCYKVRSWDSIPALNKAFYDLEGAFLQYHFGEIEASIPQILQQLQNFESYKSQYLVVIYSFLGDIYYDTRNFEQSEYYYLMSLHAAKHFMKHLNFVPDVYIKLSRLYAKTEKFESAFESLKQANEINYILYSSRSPNNRHLLEIQDNYRIEKSKIEQLAKEKRLASLEHEQSVWFLKSLIFVIGMVFILIVGILIVRFLIVKHRAEKKILENNRMLEQKQSREILEIKNKELTAFTIQLIEKEEMLANIKTELKAQKKAAEGKDNRDIEKIIRKIDHNSNQYWEEFEARFIAVNNQFYENLKKEFPKLSPYDLKICALVKLNFSGKEMAKLLGISVESVNTSRYRLRKKLGLNREDGLWEFISKF